MINLANQSLFPASLAPGWDLKRRFQMTLVVKTSCGFDEGGHLFPLENQPPIIDTNEFLGDPEASSIVAAHELQPFKHRAEFYLYGKAHPRQEGVPMSLTRVNLNSRYGQLQKNLIILGEHQWKRGLFGITRSTIDPLQPLDITYEMAWGGIDQKTGEAVANNPAGRGYNPYFWRMNDSRAPRIEYENHYSVLLSRWMDRTAGYGPLPSHWSPRNSRFGSLPDSEALDKTLCPWGPDTNPLVHQMAPDDQQLPGFFEGGEQLTLSGFFPGDKTINLKLPRLVGQALYLQKNQKPVACPLVGDTLIINTELKQLSLIYRHAIQTEHISPNNAWLYLSEDLKLNLEEHQSAG